MDTFDPAVYWLLAVFVAVLYVAIAVYAGKWFLPDDSGPEDQ